MSYYVCPQCNYQTKRNEQFCFKCGTRMTLVLEKTTCRACGKELPPYDEFCTRCGARRNTTKPRNPSFKFGWLIPGIMIGSFIVFSSPRNRGFSNNNLPAVLRQQTNQQNSKDRLRIGDEQIARIRFNLARDYEYGLNGKRKDLDQAVNLYRQSAAQGNEDAQKALKRLGYSDQ